MPYKSFTSEKPPVLKLEQWSGLGSPTGEVCKHGFHRAEIVFSYPHENMDSFAEWIRFGCFYVYSHHRRVMFVVNSNIWEVEVYS